MRPTKGSAVVLKTRAASVPPGSTCRGGRRGTMASSRVPIPTSLPADAHRTGTMCPAATPLARAAVTPPSLRPPPLPGPLRPAGPGAGRAGPQPRSFGRMQRAHHVAHEVDESGRVQQVDLVVVPGQVGDPGANGDLPLGFFGLEVQDAGPGLRF